MLNISYLDYYVPSEAYDVEAIIEKIDGSVLPKQYATLEAYQEFLESILELRNIPVELKLTTSDMLETLLKKMFDSDDVKLKPDQVDLIVLAMERRSDPTHNIGHFLQSKFGMRNANIITMAGNHCANMDICCHMVNSMSDTHDAFNNILIVNSLVTPSFKDRIIGNYGILGDGAGIILLQRQQGRYKLRNQIVQTNGLLHQANMEHDNSLLHTKYLTQITRKILSKNNVQPNEVKWALFQNANPLLFSKVMINCGFGTDQLYIDNTGLYGHLDSIDYVVNLKHLHQNKSLLPGDLVLTINMGWAGTYSAGLLEVL
jgi:3-oxoacyl-[acyl-carrier-protein] synthase III